MRREDTRAIVRIGGVPVDLNSGMTEALASPPPRFVSKHTFPATDVASRVGAIPWFAHCGESPTLDLTMGVQAVKGWGEALDACRDASWEAAQLEAQNQLSLWLHKHAPDEYRSWNDRVARHKADVIGPLTERVLAPLQERLGLGGGLVAPVQWDILGALMENSYLHAGHSAFFFLELLLVYEAGHFPCGWKGEWPRGRLVVH